MRKTLAWIFPIAMMTTGLWAGLTTRTVAEPAAKHALVCIGTEMGETVNFQSRWGEDGTWSANSVAPGKWRILSYPYDYPGENRSPQLQVRFDDDLSNKSRMVIVKVDAYAAAGKNCEKEGATYNFQERNGVLDLFRED